MGKLIIYILLGLLAVFVFFKIIGFLFHLLILAILGVIILGVLRFIWVRRRRRGQQRGRIGI